MALLELESADAPSIDEFEHEGDDVSWTLDNLLFFSQSDR